MSAPGYNQINWNCLVTGCFNYHRHYDIELLAQCFPRDIGVGDLDGFVELNRHFLIFEFKDATADVKAGQRIAFERLTAALSTLTVLVIRCDYRTSEIYSLKVIRDGRAGNWRPCNFDQFIGFVKAWANRVQLAQLPEQAA